MLGARDIFLLHRLIEELSQIIVETIVVGVLLRRDNGLAVFVFGREHLHELRIRLGGRFLLRCKSGGGKQDAEKRRSAAFSSCRSSGRRANSSDMPLNPNRREDSRDQAGEEIRNT